MANAKELRFKFYHELEGVYRRFCDELAESGLRDGEAGRLTQTILLSRQEGLKYLVSSDEMEDYLQAYPEESASTL